MMGQDLYEKGYPYTSEKEKEKKSNIAYIIFKLDINNTEEIFKNYSWDINKLDLKKGHLQAEPHFKSLTELMRKRNK